MKESEKKAKKILTKQSPCNKHRFYMHILCPKPALPMMKMLLSQRTSKGLTIFQVPLLPFMKKLREKSLRMDPSQSRAKKKSKVKKHFPICFYQILHQLS